MKGESLSEDVQAQLRPLTATNNLAEDGTRITRSSGKKRKREALPRPVSNAKRRRSSLDDPMKCGECGVSLLTAISIPDHEDYIEEPILLTDETLKLAECGQYDDTNGLPSLFVSEARIFCKNKHLCSIDGNMIETDKDLYFSGTIRCSPDAESSAGIECLKSSSINEWYVSGYGSDKVNINVITEYANYHITSVAQEYEPLFSRIFNICSYANHLIKFMQESSSSSLDEVLSEFQTCNNTMLKPPLLEDLLESAELIHAHITSFFLEPFEDGTNEEHLLSLSFFLEFCDLANLDAHNKGKGKRIRVKKSKVAIECSAKATTTPIVHDAFSHVFEEIMEIADEKAVSGMKKSADLKVSTSSWSKTSNSRRVYKAGADLGTFNSDFLYIRSMMISQGKSSMFLEPGSFVTFESSEDLAVGGYILKKPYFGQVQYLTKRKNDEDHVGHCHVRLFMVATESILGSMADGDEVFGSSTCVDVNYKRISGLLPIVHWLQQEQHEHPHQWQYRHSHCLVSGAFQSMPNLMEVAAEHNFKLKCPCCIESRKREKSKLVQPLQGQPKNFQLRGELYCPGSFVLIQSLKEEMPAAPAKETFELDPAVFTEAHRKNKGRNTETHYLPLDVCQIVSVDTDLAKKMDVEPSEVILTVRLFRRPAQTKLPEPEKMSHHLLFYTNEVFEIKANEILGLAYVACKDFLKSNLSNWLHSGDRRFYFESSYNYLQNKVSMKLPFEAKLCQGAVCPKTGSGVPPPNHRKPCRKLKCLDLFAGCGGLSAGLHAGGLADSRWACELNPSAAKAYKLNFPNATVYTQDLNAWLSDVISGKESNHLGQPYPKLGEVEMVVGGPPCQGFSVMNRYHSGEAAKFKNSLVSTFFSVVEHFKPKFFIFENVKNFAISNQGLYLKTAIKCCLKLDYQVRVSVLQAGNYGAPQSRLRTIIIGAKRGEVLPNMPKITHTINIPAFTLALDGRQLQDGTSFGWLGEPVYKSAPFRAVNVFDAISDLPDIPCGVDSHPSYKPCRSMYQEKARKGCDVLRDHITRNLSALDKARIGFIPIEGDWRDLPNKAVKLEDGSTTAPLKYLIRGNKKCVCPCGFAESKEERKKIPCVKSEVRKSILPWCLPHTADRHAHWAGLYGRVPWAGQFHTTVTIPEPMGKQGQVVHVTDNRCLSVREMARSQGMPDSFKLFGSVEDRYRQVGNAVPPPLAEAIARMFEV